MADYEIVEEEASPSPGDPVMGEVQDLASKLGSELKLIDENKLRKASTVDELLALGGYFPNYERTPVLDTPFQREDQWGIFRKYTMNSLDSLAKKHIDLYDIAHQIAADLKETKEAKHENLVPVDFIWRIYDQAQVEQQAQHQHTGFLYMFISKCNGNLLILTDQNLLQEEEARICFTQVLGGLKYLVEQNEAKDGLMNLLDINPANIIFSDVNGRREYKLLNMKLTKNNWAKEEEDQPRYMAPELIPFIFNKKSLEEIDWDPVACAIYSLGMVLGDSVLENQTFDRLRYTIGTVEKVASMLRVDQDLCDLLRGMTEHKWTKRMTLDQVLSHPWVLQG